MKTTLFFILLSVLRAAAQEPATDYRVTSAFPKYVTAAIEFRDPSGALWPNFFYGKPADDAGAIAFDPAKPAANFALSCDQMAQAKGDQSRRVLGALPPPLAARLTISAMGAIQPAEAGAKDKATHVAELTGTLEIAGRKVAVKGPARLRRHEGKGDERNPALMLDGHFTVRGTDLGLKTPAAVEVRATLTAYPPVATDIGTQRKLDP